MPPRTSAQGSARPTKLLLSLLALPLVLTACEPPVGPEVDRQFAVTTGGSESQAFVWFVARPPAAPPPFPSGPPANPAVAPNGDILLLGGVGTLTLNPKSADGGGHYEHRAADGTLIRSGSWTVTGLRSFQSYGMTPFIPPFPPGASAGTAHLSVELEWDGGTRHGNLRVDCLLPGVDTPNNMEEGVSISLNGGMSFIRVGGGGTIFIKF